MTSSELKIIEEEIKQCRKCRLWETRINAVPGEGPENAEVMFIGEAPGANEDRQGRPFVGAAGQLLTELLQKAGLSRDEVYITNVVKCRPPGNRDPRPDEIAACSPYLDAQIRVIKPKIIVTLGRHSTKYLLGKGGINVSGITRVRGKTFKIEIGGIPVTVVPTYHPAAALYNPRLRTVLEKDFIELIGGKAKKDMGRLDAYF